MRLIDAEERRTEIDEEDRWVVDGAITVDAIPIEWIQNIIDEIDKSICNVKLETNYDYQVLAHALERRTSLVCLIRYWRKENS